MSKTKKMHTILAEAVVHFKSGASLRGGLNEFYLADDSKSLRKALTDPDVMREVGDQEISFINLDEVVFINISQVKVQLKEDTGGRHEGDEGN